MATAFFLTYSILFILESKAKVTCTSGACNINCNLQNCDIVICTNQASSCSIICNDNNCRESNFYLAASNFNRVDCNGGDSCRSINIECGVPQNLPNGYSKSNFIGHINECKFILSNNAIPDSGKIQCIHDIDICQLDAITDNDDFKESQFQCQLSPQNAKCIMNCHTDKSCGSKTSNFNCIAPQCQCIGNGCNQINKSFATANPTSSPTINPTIGPTNHPTLKPTNNPTNDPTNHPTKNPTNDPTKAPTNTPTIYPTMSPTQYPSNNPTKHPTMDPTVHPTIDPTNHPSIYPTKYPSNHPTNFPTQSTFNSTISPTIHSNAPSVDPTIIPTLYPTNDPSIDPTIDSTPDPTDNPTSNPMIYPIPNPTSVSSTNPTIYPTNNPTLKPIEYDYDSNLVTHHGSQFNCNDTKTCFNDILNCDDNRPCYIDCNGDNVCQYAVINCPFNAECNIYCRNGYDACKYATIFAYHSQSLLIDCGDFDEGCDQITIQCPHNRYQTSISCIISGINNKNVVHRMDIFAVNGFNDLLVMASELNNVYLHCNNDFSSHCLLSNTSPFKCISDDIICQQYLPSTSKSTQQSTINGMEQILTKQPTLDVFVKYANNTIDAVIMDDDGENIKSKSHTVRNIFILIICILVVLVIKYHNNICKKMGHKMGEISEKYRKHEQIFDIDQEKIDKDKDKMKLENIYKINNESHNLLIATTNFDDDLIESDEERGEGVHIEMTTFNVSK